MEKQNETIVYDIIEQMGSQDEAIEYYSSKLPINILSNEVLSQFRVVKMLSAYQDL